MPTFLAFTDLHVYSQRKLSTMAFCTPFRTGGPDVSLPPPLLLHLQSAARLQGPQENICPLPLEGVSVSIWLVHADAHTLTHLWNPPESHRSWVMESAGAWSHSYWGGSPPFLSQPPQFFNKGLFSGCQEVKGAGPPRGGQGHRQKKDQTLAFKLELH